MVGTVPSHALILGMIWGDHDFGKLHTIGTYGDIPSGIKHGFPENPRFMNRSLLRNH